MNGIQKKNLILSGPVGRIYCIIYYMIKEFRDLQMADIKDSKITPKELESLVVDLVQFYESLSVAEFFDMEYGIK